MARVCAVQVPPPQTKRLIFREMVSADAEALFDLLGDPVAMRFFPCAFTRPDAALWVERNQERYRIFGCGLWAVLHRQTGELLGDCGPVWHEINDELQFEIGYHFRRVHWGQGYATEAAAAAISWSFQNVAVDHLISLIRPENSPSRKVAERNGLAIAGETMWRGYRHLIYRMDQSKWKTASYDEM